MNIILYIFSNLIAACSCKLQMRVMKTAILNFLPQLKLHDLVLISKMNETGDIYSIDFTPINQSHHKTLRMLLLGKNVPAELRIRRYKNINMHDDKTILKMWDSNITEKLSRELSESIYTSIQDNEIKEMFDRFLLWEKNKQYMNLYTRNCQHFGDYAINVHQSYME